MAVACTWAAPVGLDIEAVEEDETASGLLDRVASPEDRLDVREHRALVTWTMKEAYLKAVGTGLRTPPATVTLVGDARRTQVVTAPDGLPIAEWAVGVPVRAGYLAAACVLGGTPAVAEVRQVTPPPDEWSGSSLRPDARWLISRG